MEVRITFDYSKLPTRKTIYLDCEEGRKNGCGSRCCTFWFLLTPEEIDKKIVRYDEKFPSVIKIEEDGFCTHFDRELLICNIFKNRPKICREYDCRKDERIWK